MFGLLKKLFSKPIAADDTNENELIDMCVLKNNELKLNSELMVEENYYCIIMHYDDMCDILSTGKYKVNDRDLPRLMRFAKAVKTKKGLIAPKSVQADIYFVNMKPISDNLFKTPYKVTTYDGDKRVKVKVYGSYTLKTDSPTKLVAGLRNDYDCLKNGVAIKELSAIIGYVINQVANKEKLKLKDFQDSNANLLEMLTEKINKKLDEYGCILSDLKITKVVLPKNYQPSSIIVEEVKFDDFATRTSPKEQADNLEQPVPVMARGENEAKVNTDDVINLGYGSVEQPKPQSAQEIYEAYSKQFSSASQGTETNQPAPNIFGTQAQSSEPAVQTMEPPVQTLQPQEPILNANIAKVDSVVENDGINLLNSNDKIVKQQDTLSVKEYVERENKIEDIKDFVFGENRPKPEKPKKSTQDTNKTNQTQNPPQDKSIPKGVKVCPVCAQSMAIDARFCSNCGANVSETIICKACGIQNQGDARFCKLCGSKLN